MTASQRIEPATRPDGEDLFARHARRLHAVVSATVRTSAENVDDTCGFAWLKLMRHRPPAGVAFAWLRTTAVREAVKLQHRTGRLMDLGRLAEVAPDRDVRPEPSLALIAAAGLAGEPASSGSLERRHGRRVSSPVQR